MVDQDAQGDCDSTWQEGGLRWGRGEVPGVGGGGGEAKARPRSSAPAGRVWEPIDVIQRRWPPHQARRPRQARRLQELPALGEEPRGLPRGLPATGQLLLQAWGAREAAVGDEAGRKPPGAGLAPDHSLVVGAGLPPGPARGPSPAAGLRSSASSALAPKARAGPTPQSWWTTTSRSACWAG